MATIAPIPNNNTSTSSVNNTASSSTQATVTQSTGTPAKGNLSTDNSQRLLQQSLATLNTTIKTYGLDANPLQLGANSSAGLPQLSPENVKNIVSLLMNVMADLAIAMRKANMESRQLDLANQVNALLSQVQSMKNAADNSRTSALITAITGAVMGAVSVGMGSLALKKTLGARTDIKAMEASLKDPAQPADNTAFTLSKSKADYKTGLGQSLTQLGNSINSLVTSGAGAVSAKFKYDADMDSALAQEFAATATKFAAAYDQDNNFAQNFLQFVSGALQSAKAISDAEANTLQSITKNMA